MPIKVEHKGCGVMSKDGNEPWASSTLSVVQGGFIRQIDYSVTALLTSIIAMQLNDVDKIEVVTEKNHEYHITNGSTENGSGN